MKTTLTVQEQATASHGASYVRELLRASDLITLGHLIAREASRRFGFAPLALIWWSRSTLPDVNAGWSIAPAGDLGTVETELLRLPPERKLILPCTIQELVSGVLGGAALATLPGKLFPRSTEWVQFREDVAGAVGRLLELESLTQSVTRLERAERLQRALYAIADMASSDLDMPDMLHGVHKIMSELMYAENFFILQVTPGETHIQFLYFADSEDPDPPTPGQTFAISEMENSISLAMIRSGQAQMGPSRQLRESLGLVEEFPFGPPSISWLGVPVGNPGAVRGALVVQSYTDQHTFDDDDRALLSYVAQHILTALDRKRVQEDLELHVEQRTRDLAAANADLRQQVIERERSERLQAALYRIAEISSTAGSLEEFYAEVHEIVGHLLYARNFYIALVSDDGRQLEFPYSVDERDQARNCRELANGLTEFVLHAGRPLLIDREGVELMAAAGEVQSFGPRSLSWLGVPLICEERAVGVIAVQSYSRETSFSARDQELLTFVGYHIANGLERKRARDSLLNANTDLELRVADRTLELAIANRDLTDQIVERERIEETLKHQALHDTLTGLPNRSLLLDRLARALTRYRREESNGFAVLFLDLDRFKVINDSVGHLVGDELLKQAAERLAHSVREPDIVARLGGDEFAVLLDDLQDPDRATHVAERLISVLSEPMRIGGKELFTSASIGIAFSHPRYTRPEELLRDADVAMYRAKAQGRQRIELFDEQLRAEALRVLDLEGDLRRALARGEFEPHFQSIVRLEDAAVVGYEALLRWRHSERGLLSPGDFLNVAEDNGLIEQIDWQMFALACREACRLPHKDAYVSINVSARQLRAADFDRSVLRLIGSQGMDPHRVRLEVTEGALLDNPDHVRRLLERLREAGVLVQLDDFGTGYSSLSYLHQLPIHALKIDRSFISDLQPGQNRGSTAVVRAIHALSESLGLEVIGEGIETHEQCLALKDLGCQLGQGFLFSRPQAVDDVIRGQQQQQG